MPSLEEVRASFEVGASNRFFGLRLLDCSAEHAEVAMPVRPEYTQEEGIVHGGVLTALADTAAVYSILPGLPDGRTITSIELKLNFLRPASPAGGELGAYARVIRRGVRIAVADVEVSQDERLVAKGLFTYLVLDATSR